MPREERAQLSRYLRVVPITFARRNGEWAATVTPPDGPVFEAGPGPLLDVVRTLVNCGCHQTDVSDAVFAADPRAWQELLDPERNYERYYKDRM